MENAILTIIYGLTLGVATVAMFIFMVNEYDSLKLKNSWPTAESTQEEEQGEQTEKGEAPEEKSELTDLPGAESGFNDHQYKGLLK